MPLLYRHFAVKASLASAPRPRGRASAGTVEGVWSRSNPSAHPSPMTSIARRRFARREDLGLGSREYAILDRLSTPRKIQDFLDTIPINHEVGGETILSVREVLAQRRAHCIEAAFVGACALWIHGEPPWVMHLDCAPSDYPHVVALFRRSGAWGAISKSNGTPLRYRDPVYRSLRELAMSYFHEYSDRHGRKTLRSYSVAFDLRRLDPALWVISKRACMETNDRLASARHYPLITLRQERSLARRDAFELRAAKTVEYPAPTAEVAKTRAR